MKTDDLWEWDSENRPRFDSTGRMEISPYVNAPWLRVDNPHYSKEYKGGSYYKWTPEIDRFMTRWLLERKIHIKDLASVMDIRWESIFSRLNRIGVPTKNILTRAGKSEMTRDLKEECTKDLLDLETRLHAL